MTDLKIPIILPEYLCYSNTFANFVSDLKNYRIKNIIVPVDYVFETESPAFHLSKIRRLKFKFKELSKENSVRFKFHTNLLMENIIYSPLDIAAIASKKSNLFFITLPLGTNAEVAMKNIFTIKNLGYIPVIMNFDSVAVFYPQSFCKALLTTENIYFCFNSNSLDDPKIDSYIRTALSLNNTVLFLCSHFTSSLFYKNVERYIRILPKKYKLNFVNSTSQSIKKIFRLK
jgi:hypothetical protein